MSLMYQVPFSQRDGRSLVSLSHAWLTSSAPSLYDD